MVYAALAADLRSWAQVRALDGAAIPFEAASSIERIVEWYADHLSGVHEQGEVVLVGWSAGGAVAFELARVLRRCGTRARLVLLDAYCLPYEHPVWRALSSVEMLAAMESDYREDRGPGHSAAVVTDATRRGLEALIAYRPEPFSIQGRYVMALGADGSRRAQVWVDRSEGGLVVERLPVGHFDMLQAPFAAMAASAVRNETRAER